MKKISLHITCLMGATVFFATSQAQVFTTIMLHTTTNYSIVATGDTAYEREAVIYMEDTSNIQSVKAELSVKSDHGWQTKCKSILPKPINKSMTCHEPICIYRRNNKEWVVWLGYYSLYTFQRLELWFNTPDSKRLSPADWSNEF